MAYIRRSKRTFRGMRVGTGYARAAVATKSKRLTYRQKAIKAKAKGLMVYKPKSRYASRYGKKLSTTTVDRGTQNDPAGVDHTRNKYYAPLTRTKPNTLSYIKKLVIGNEQKQVFRWSALGDFENTTDAPFKPLTVEVGGGKNWLYNYYNTGTGDWWAPVYLFDVTSVNQFASGALQGYNPSWRLKFNSPGAPTKAYWEQTYCQNPNGANLTAASSWQGEETSGATTVSDSYPLKRCMFDWVHAKILAYGASKKATTFKVSFFQLTEDWLHPDMEIKGVYDIPNNAQIPYQQTASEFWYAYTRPLTGNPANSAIGYNPKFIKVLKEYNFTLQPQTTIETDADIGHSKLIDIFMPINRVCNYDWAREVTTGVAQYLQQSYVSFNGQARNTVHPKARIYMCVSATNPVFCDNVTPTISYTPSFDINIRKRITTFT